MVIGAMGLEFGSGNKGCEALGFSFLDILNQIAESQGEVFDVKIGIGCNLDRITRELDCTNLRLSCFSLGKITAIGHKLNAFKECDIVYDFTAGDSFSDIYGLRRFLRWTMNKQCVILAKKPLVLGSQTYGPYKSLIAKMWASHILKKAYRVYARDELSKVAVEKLAHRTDVHQTVDIAFALPYNRDQYKIKCDRKIKIGFNPSGLLWAGGYNRNNQFSMTLDYPTYCINLLKGLMENGKYEIYLVPHVLYTDLSCADNDMVACEELKKKFPELIMAPWFDTPMDAKSFISNMDIFIGSRMHATIASFTSGVVTIPVSYSRKFEGLFNSVGYPYVVSGTKVSTEKAIQDTLIYVEDLTHMTEILNEKRKTVVSGVDELLKSIEEDISTIQLRRYNDGHIKK